MNGVAEHTVIPPTASTRAHALKGLKALTIAEGTEREGTAGDVFLHAVEMHGSSNEQWLAHTASNVAMHLEERCPHQAFLARMFALNALASGIGGSIGEMVRNLGDSALPEKLPYPTESAADNEARIKAAFCLVHSLTLEGSATPSNLPSPHATVAKNILGVPRENLTMNTSYDLYQSTIAVLSEFEKEPALTAFAQIGAQLVERHNPSLPIGGVVEVGNHLLRSILMVATPAVGDTPEAQLAESAISRAEQLTAASRWGKAAELQHEAFSALS